MDDFGINKIIFCCRIFGNSLVAYVKFDWKFNEHSKITKFECNQIKILA